MRVFSHQDIESHINDCCDVRVSQCEELADSSAFAILKSSRKANDAWEKPEMADDSRFRRTAGEERRRSPKVMQGMPIAVDTFCYGVIPGVTS
jgi:hypothetical protein